MKKKKVEKDYRLFITIVGIVLVIAILCLLLFFGGKKKDSDENHIPNPDDPSFGSVELPFNKYDVMTLINQTKELNNDKEKWTVSDAALIAHTEDNSMYLIRYIKLTSEGIREEYESIVTIKNEEKKIDLPGWEVNTKDMDSFDFIYYSEDSEGYDPENQQYSKLITENDELSDVSS